MRSDHELQVVLSDKLVRHLSPHKSKPADATYPKSINCMQLNYPRDPSIQIIPRLGPKVYQYFLHWAIWSLIGLV